MSEAVDKLCELIVLVKEYEADARARELVIEGERAKSDSLESKLRAAEFKLEKLEECEQEEEQEFSECIEQLKEARKAISHLNTELNSARQSFWDICQEREEKIASLTADYEGACKQLDNARAEIMRLKKRIASLLCDVKENNDE